MKKKYLDYKGFEKLDVVFDENKFTNLKKSMINEYGLFNVCEFKLKLDDANDQKLYELLEDLKKASVSFLVNIGNQIFVQTGHEETKRLPYPPMSSETLELPREEAFNLTLNSIKKTRYAISNNLDGYMRYPEKLENNRHIGVIHPPIQNAIRYHKPLKDGEISIPANLWLKEATNTIQAIDNTFEYFNPYNYTTNCMDK